MIVTAKIMVLYTILAVSFVGTQSKHSYVEVSPSLEKELNHESRKAECCAKKMRCCKKRPPPANVEIRAIIARCIEQADLANTNRNLNKKLLSRNNLNNLQKFQGFDEDEPLIQSEVTKCSKKLILTMKINNNGETDTRNQYIVLDHVYDPLSDQIVRLLNPYVIKMKQEHISQTYSLKFLDFVNSQAREQVYNKHDANYTGCCLDKKKPTCGLVTFQGKAIPYSSGFCCSCDAQKNQKSQPETKQNPVIGYSDPAYLLDEVQCPRTHIYETSSDLRAEKRKKKPVHKEKEKDDKKRDMDTDNIYYLNPQTKYKKWRTLDNRIDDLESKFGDVKAKDRSDHFGSENNYKVQTMNDEYEDHLTSSGNSLDQFNKDSNNLEELSKNMYISRNKLNNANNNAVKPKVPVKHSYATEKSSRTQNFNTKSNKKQKNDKSFSYKLLNSNDLFSPVSIYNFKSNMRSIADKAFNEAIKSQRKEEANRKTLQEDTGPSPEDLQFDLPESFFKKQQRQVQSSGVQRRGGQNCADRYTPPHLNPESYHESTHCLRFSRVWYGVYKLDRPVVEQETIFQVYEKFESENGIVKWKDLTKGKKVKLGTFWPFYKDEVPSIAMTFSSVFDDQDFCLDWHHLRLLIPEGIKYSELSTFPEAKGGPSEYLLVPNDKIVVTGDQCNVVGVGFEAFYKQPNRCSMPRGSCLHHQPYHMWYHDKKLEKSGQTGCYFLKNHGKLSKNPIRKNASNNDKFLTLNYYGHYISLVDMEINADFNSVLRPTSTAIITEVYIDSTCPSRTFITVKVSNGGLLSSKFMVRIADCPLEIKDTLDDVQSNLVLIPPQLQHIFKLSVHTELHVDIFHCSVEVLNAKNELVALRRIKIQKLDRCICTWHCLCACIGSSSGLKCIPMKIDHYHAAGFRGGLPIITQVEHITLSNDIVNLVLFILSFILFMLFILGFTKALIGLCCLPIGMWGLNSLLDLPKPMNRYYDKKLEDRSVVYDESGWPIHPDTGARVRNIPATAEFCTNILFFFTYPTVMFLLLLKRICCPFYVYKKVPKVKMKKKSWFKKRGCNWKNCTHRETQANNETIDAESNVSNKKEDQPEEETAPAETQGVKSSPSDNKDKKKKPVIKVSIKERVKDKSPPKTPEKKPSLEDSESVPYYYSSTDDATVFSNTTNSTKKSSD